jgi:hypothetical protein
MQYSDITMRIKLRKLEDCAYIGKIQVGNKLLNISLTDIWENKNYQLNGALLLDYVYLDSNERKLFIQSGHEYLIDVTNYDYVDNISLTNNNLIYKLNGFMHPTIEILWVIQKKELINNDDSYKKSYFNMFGLENDIGNPFIYSTLKISGNTLVDRFDNKFFNYYVPYIKHKRSPKDGINVYSFSLFPEEHQPSGTCNLSVISSGIFNFIINIIKCFIIFFIHI